jgi:hypothetical protein
MIFKFDFSIAQWREVHITPTFYERKKVSDLRPYNNFSGIIVHKIIDEQTMLIDDNTSSKNSNQSNGLFTHLIITAPTISIAEAYLTNCSALKTTNTDNIYCVPDPNKRIGSGGGNCNHHF